MMELHFTKTNGPADEAIDELIRLVGGVHHPELIREMILAALKGGQEEDDRANLRLMNTTMKEMRFTGKIFGTYRNIRKVTVFGSARTKPDESVYEASFPAKGRPGKPSRTFRPLSCRRWRSKDYNPHAKPPGSQRRLGLIVVSCDMLPVTLLESGIAFSSYKRKPLSGRSFGCSGS